MGKRGGGVDGGHHGARFVGKTLPVMNGTGGIGWGLALHEMAAVDCQG